jgi:hypothetical protein
MHPSSRVLWKVKLKVTYPGFTVGDESKVFEGSKADFKREWTSYCHNPTGTPSQLRKAAEAKRSENALTVKNLHVALKKQGCFPRWYINDVINLLLQIWISRASKCSDARIAEMKEITKKFLGTMTGSQAALDVFVQHVKPCASGLSADFDNLQALLPEENPEGWVEVYGSAVGKAHAAAFQSSLAPVALCKEAMGQKGTLMDVLTSLLQNKVTPSAPSLAVLPSSATSASPQKAVTFVFEDDTEDFVSCSGKSTMREAYQKAAAENDGLMPIDQVGSLEIQNTARQSTIAITMKNAGMKRVRDYDHPSIFGDGLTFKVIKQKSPGVVANEAGGES